MMASAQGSNSNSSNTCDNSISNEAATAATAGVRHSHSSSIPRLTVQEDEASKAKDLDLATTPIEPLVDTAATMGNNESTGSHASSSTEGGESSTELPAGAVENPHSVHSEQEGFATSATVASDGRVDIHITQQNRRLSGLLAPLLRRQQSAADNEAAPPKPYIPPSLGGDATEPPPPPMNVVIQVVGSRGDVQPFIALGQVLKKTYGHRVRLATHPNFKDFVQENGLEFFSIGGDPTQLMAFMVKNPGLMPGFDSLRSGDVGKRRREVAEYLKGCWRSCFETGDGLGPEAVEVPVEDWGTRLLDEADGRPFVADCIIANPPSFAHVHCAEKLGIPLHVMFTMPYSPTQAFPHPLANIQSSNADPHLTNYVSYALIDMLTWQGLGDIINAFRQKSLNLEPISLLWAPGMLQRLKIPHTYCWSPALIPKPKDWPQHISISGFFFLNLASNYTPDPDLQAFLDAGPPPVYIGFGSIVLDDPNEMTRLIFEAVRVTGQRVLLSKGWGGMGAEELGLPDGVFMLGNVPHDWLFKQVSCVVHHGGAGTTAAGITAGKPTVVVPFFGDQTFWGSMVARAGAGPEPIPHKELTAEKLVEAVRFCLRPESQQRAEELAARIAREKGTDRGAQHFHQMLNVDKLRCTLSPNRPAVWRIKRTQVRLSALAACTLAKEGLLDFNDLKLFRPKEYETDEGPWDPISGGASAIVGTMGTMMLGVADFPIDTLKALKIHPEATKKKEASLKPEDSTEVASSSTNRGDQSPMSPSSGASTPSGLNTPASSQPAASTVTAASTAFSLQESLEKVQSQASLASGIQKPNAMADALRGQLGPTRARSRSNSRSNSRSKSNSMSNNIDTAIGTAKGVRKIVSAGLKSPMDFTMAVAKGFHNAPKLYGDDTVRTPDTVTDFRTGLRTASKEFGYGIYDGISGLVTQPVQGARKEGAAGFVKGIGKGIGGVVLKTSGAAFSIPGYTMKGIYKEVQLMFGSSVINYIIAARTAQGFDDWQRSSPGEREEIIERWHVKRKDLKKKKNPDEIVLELLEEQKNKGIALGHEIVNGIEQRYRSRSRSNSTAHVRMSSDSSRSRPSEEQGLRSNTRDSPLRQQSTRAESSTHLDPSNTATPLQQPNSDDDEDLQRALQASAAETSNRLETQDKTSEDELERAIAASRIEHERRLDTQSEAPTHDEELQQAIDASLVEARRKAAAENEHDEQLQFALSQSLAESQSTHEP